MSATSILSPTSGLGSRSKPNSIDSRTGPSSSPSLAVGTHDGIALARCLSALTSKILTNPPQALLHSAYERTKTNANLEYARTLLLRLEHATASARVQARKHAAQARLAEQRAQLKVLGDRLWEIGQADTGTGAIGGEPDPLILKLIGDGTAAPEQEAPTVPEVVVEEEAPAPVEVASTVIPAAASTESHLRARKQLLGSSSSHTTGTSLSSAAPSSTTPFSDPPSKPSASSAPSPGTAAHLDLQDSVQTDLTQSMLSLAAQLKASAQRFADTLEADADTVGRTEGALGRNQAGLDSATKKMGVLSKMSEGRWWWGRMALYAGIVGLWIIAVLIVFVGPKLRF